MSTFCRSIIKKREPKITPMEDNSGYLFEFNCGKIRGGITLRYKGPNEPYRSKDEAIKHANLELIGREKLGWD